MDAARTRAIAERKAAAPPARRAGEQRHAAAGPCPGDARRIAGKAAGADMEFRRAEAAARSADADGAAQGVGRSGRQERSEEHTSELQSLMRNLVCRLLREKTKIT